MLVMDTFDEHDMATARGFKDADAYYADLWEKSCQAQEYDELRRIVETVYGMQEEPDRANQEGE